MHSMLWYRMEICKVARSAKEQLSASHRSKDQHSGLIDFSLKETEGTTAQPMRIDDDCQLSKT